MTKYETVDISICADCVMLIANGELIDDGIDAKGDALDAAIEAIWPYEQGWELSVGNDTHGFSWSSCDSCGSHLGGERHEAYAMRPVRNA